MRWIITDPRGVAPALRGEHAQSACLEEPLPRLLEEIVDQPPLKPNDRLDIYAIGYLSRIVEAMAGDMETVSRALGEAKFHRLVDDYLRSFPSKTFTVCDIGAHLSQFIRASAWNEQYPFLADLARLDWLAQQSYFADDSKPFDTNSLNSRTPEDWNTAIFLLAPSVGLVASDWSLSRIWGKREYCSQTIREQVKASPEKIMVYRDGEFDVCLELLDEISYSFISQLKAGKSLLEATEFLTLVSKFNVDQVQQCFCESLGPWVAQGIISDIRFP